MIKPVEVVENSDLHVQDTYVKGALTAKSKWNITLSNCDSESVEAGISVSSEMEVEVEDKLDKKLDEILSEYQSKLSKIGKILLSEFVAEHDHLNDDEKLSKVIFRGEELLVSHRVPDILMIDFDPFKKLQRFLRYPDDADMTIPLQNIDRDNSLMVFISHCWMRGWNGAEGWYGKPHPDNSAGDKYKLCVKGIEEIKSLYASRMKNCYIWLDYGCMDQDNKSTIYEELERYDKVVQCCDVMFTPIVDLKQSEWLMPTAITSYFDDYKAKLWNDGPHAYLNRGWCRIEMLYAANIPVMQNNNVEVKRHTMFDFGLAHHCEQNRRPHYVYGHKELESKRPPICLPPLQHSYFDDYHPLKGYLSVDSDIEHIESLIAELKPYMDANKVNVGYVGESNEAGEAHGSGTFHYADGGLYVGEFKNGKQSGYGKYTLANATVFEGEFSDDLLNGIAIAKYADGNVHIGEFKNGKSQGNGIIQYTDGTVYEGEFNDGRRHGQAKVTSVAGVFEGEYKLSKMDGYGTFHYANNDVYNGMWCNGKKDGKGTMIYANRDVFDGEWINDSPVK